MQNKKIYDLEDRTFNFAKNCRYMIRDIDKKLINIDDCKQLLRSSGSVAANYIEANESLSKKDFIMRIKICRKEAKESELWLKLMKETSNNLCRKIDKQIKEAFELRKIFGSILEKCK